MKDKENMKEHIIGVTISLIEQTNGNTKEITARKIAEKSGIGLGLINYHFGSKDNLITLCVQRIINNVVFSFSPEKMDYSKADGLSDKERLIDWAAQVFEFLFANYAISRISILGDMQDYREKTNSVYTQKGFSFALRDKKDEKEKKLLAFVLVSAMQTAFLSGEAAKEILGYDFKLKEERRAFVEDTVSMLLERADDREGSDHA